MTTKADTRVRWFMSDMPDAPVLSGQAGKMIELLDACLLTGFCARTPDSVVVADGVATVTISAGNPYRQHAVIEVSGASDPALNDVWRIATATATTLTFACPGVANGTVTGGSVKMAPLGWEKPFADAGAYKAVYKSADPISSGCHLRVLDSNAQWARVRGYESMTDVDTGVNPFPTPAQLAEASVTWPKSNQANSSARPWVIVGDGALVYPILEWSPTHPYDDCFAFGDLAPFQSGDVYPCFLGASFTATPPYPNFSAGYALNTAVQAGHTPRTRDGGYAPYLTYASHANGIGTSSSSSMLLTSAPTFMPVAFTAGSAANSGPRGIFPGIFTTADHIDLTNRKTVITLDGKPAMVVRPEVATPPPAPRMRAAAVLLDGWRP